MTRQIDKDTFLHYYALAGGDYKSTARLLKNAGLREISLRTYFRYKNAYLNLGEATDNDDRPVYGGVIHSPDKYRSSLKGKRFVFTSAQNNTLVHKNFFNNLKEYCYINKSELVVSTFTYNKHAYSNKDVDNADGLWYDPLIVPYINNKSCTLTDAIEGLVYCGELDVIPTAARPLSGFDSYTHTSSSIIPHAKVSMITVPTLKGAYNKFMYTTGAITLRNYIERKAGQKAAFHHVYGALVVEIDEDGLFFARHIIADEDGNFYDLEYYYSDGVPYTNQRVEAITYGDFHAEAVDEHAFRACVEMRDILRPKYQFLHDITDFRPRNHHTINDPHENAYKYYNKQDSVLYGMRLTKDLILKLLRKGTTTVVVESNHDLAFERWLKNPMGHSDVVNAKIWHEYNMQIHEALFNRTKIRPFVQCMYDLMLDENNIFITDLVYDLIFLETDESFKTCNEHGNGIENGMHGHMGASGSRGNPLQFRKLGVKTNTGHTHSAMIIDGVYVAGCNCKLDMGYNKGASTWSHSDIITYANAKRTIITKKNGKWRA